MSDLLPDLELIASEESQQDWDRLEYGRIYRKAFIDGAKYAEEQLKAKVAELERERDECAVVIAKYARSQNVNLADICCKADEILAKRDLEQQIKALMELDINPQNESEDRVFSIIQHRIEQLRKGATNDTN